MDIELLHFFNQTLAHPLLDGLMVGATTIGFALLPALGVTLLLAPGQRRTGVTILAALAAGFLATLIFQYLAFRPRPEGFRLLLATPDFPSYPSGHAVAAFAVATVVGLTKRQLRWWIMAFVGAALIALSRVYLGVHYPSDGLGGAILGVALGAACYGILGQPKPDWRWLLWLQIAIVVVVTHMAYLNILPGHLLHWPMADKVLHFLLFGAVVFWLNLWLNGRSVQLGQWAVVPVAILLPFTIAMLEEGAQSFSPLRSASLGDLTSDLAGMLVFWRVSRRFISAKTQLVLSNKRRFV